MAHPGTAGQEARVSYGIGVAVWSGRHIAPPPPVLFAMMSNTTVCGAVVAPAARAAKARPNPAGGSTNAADGTDRSVTSARLNLGDDVRRWRDDACERPVFMASSSVESKDSVNPKVVRAW